MQPRPQSQLRTALRALVAVVAILMLTSAALLIKHLREERLVDAGMRAEATARLLEEHILRTFRSTEFILDQVVRLGRSQPLDQLAASPSAWAALQDLKNGLPERGTLWVADAGGIMRLGSLWFPTKPADISDRYYFQAHKRARQSMVVGPLVKVKNREGEAFHLSKRIEDDAGNLLGVAVAGVEAPYFTIFHANLGLGSASNVAIFDTEGHVILRQPDPERWVGTSVAAGPLMTALTQSDTGMVQARSPLDGIERVVAYRLIRPFGIVVSCGIGVEELMGAWWEAVVMTVAALLAAGLALATLSGLAFRSLAREEATVEGLERTVRERTEEAIHQAEEARRANQSKTKLLAAASHDLRQPLQAAGMFIEALAARLGDSPHLSIIDKLRQSVEATQSLLTSLLDVSTLEAGRCQPSIVAFPLAPTLAALADQMEPQAAQRGLKLKVVSTDAWVNSDPVLLERILRNLLVNALRYTETGGVLIGCRRRSDGRLAVQVVDTGIGIPPDQFEAVFEDFIRLNDRGDATTRGLGLGLGLPVVRRMATLLGHDIELQSVVGRGSTFGVVMPLARSGSSPPTQASARHDAATP